MHIEVGDYTVHIFETGSLWMDGGSVFGAIPKALWSQKVACDSLNRVELKMRSLLLEGHSQLILIDTGLGRYLSDRICQLYQIDKLQINLEQKIRGCGFTPDDVSAVILTHLHFDHIGGALTFSNDRARSTFPAATYYVQRRNFEWALQPCELDRASYHASSFLPLYEQGKLLLLDGETELFPDVKVLVSDGHTIGQQLVLIEDAKQPLLFCADLIPTAKHVALTWGSGFDLQPLKLLAEKKILLPRAAAENWLLVFPHESKICLGHLIPGEKSFQVLPVGDDFQ